MKPHRLSFVPCLFLLACVGAPDLGTTQQLEICDTCPDEGGGTSPDYCDAVCSDSIDCNTGCVDRDGSSDVNKTCGQYQGGTCQLCVDTCSAEASCAAGCMTETGNIATCDTAGQCHRYDVYCAYPGITEAWVSDAHEDGAGGAYAYMYYASAPASKYDTYTSRLGEFTYDTNEAWASNFRGPVKLVGESARPQWEFGSGGDPALLRANFPSKPAPYHYGATCVAVSAGAPRPSLGSKAEDVWEDDECIGRWPYQICNPDDHVGGFAINRDACSAVFGGKATSGWTGILNASLWGSITRLNYKLYCYSCRNSPTRTCEQGTPGSVLTMPGMTTTTLK